MVSCVFDAKVVRQRNRWESSASQNPVSRMHGPSLSVVLSPSLGFAPWISCASQASSVEQCFTSSARVPLRTRSGGRSIIVLASVE